MLVVTSGVGGIPAEARHRGGGHTGLGKLSGEEEVLGNAVVVEGVEGEVRRSSSTFTDLGLKRSTGSATAASTAQRTIVVVGGHGAAFAFEAFAIEGHLTVFTEGNLSVQHHVVFKHQLVDGIVAFRNFGEGQRVVVVQGDVV